MHRKYHLKEKRCIDCLSLTVVKFKRLIPVRKICFTYKQCIVINRFNSFDGITTMIIPWQLLSKNCQGEERNEGHEQARCFVDISSIASIFDSFSLGILGSWCTSADIGVVFFHDGLVASILLGILSNTCISFWGTASENLNLVADYYFEMDLII